MCGEDYAERGVEVCGGERVGVVVCEDARSGFEERGVVFVYCVVVFFVFIAYV